MQFTDQLGRKIYLDEFPKRIVSIVPSQTELLYDLGLANRVVGITKFCIHPNSWYKEKKRVGGTKNINFNVFNSLQPDLVIANKEENTKSEVEQLMKNYPVWVSDIGNLKDSLTMISSIGELTNTVDKASAIVAKITADFDKLYPLFNSTVAYIIWNKPMMSVNKTRFIHDMLQRNGFTNVFANCTSHYPTITKEQIQKANPAFILLSSEPFPFKQKHIDYYQNICPNSKVVLVDGELFSWYGSRLQKSVEYFSNLFNNL